MTSGSPLLAEYGAYHRDRRNLICHEIGIPLIVLGVIALLRLVTFSGSASTSPSLAVVLLMVYYAAAFGREARAATFIAIVGLARAVRRSRASSRGRSRSRPSSPAGSSSSSGTRTKASRPRS